MVSLLRMARCGASGTFPDVDPGDRTKIAAAMRLGSLPTQTGTRPKCEEGAPTGVPPLLQGCGECRHACGQELELWWEVSGCAFSGTIEHIINTGRV